MANIPSFSPRQEIALLVNGRYIASPSFIRWLDLNLKPTLDSVVDLSDDQVAQITINTNKITLNTGNIAVNASNISTNTSNIAANSTAIADLLTRIEALEFNAESLYVGRPTNTAAAVYTSTGVTTTLSAATAFNGSGTSETLDVWLVPNGGSATDANKLYEALTVADGATVDLSALVGHALDPGDAVYLAASTSTTISVRLTGATRS